MSCSASATSRCRGCATSSSSSLLLSFISTFNQFGLIFLMTGGGPSGATRLYSILAYEKAIGSLQYGPGSAIALSVAPLMALLIWLLARFMRHDDERGARDATGRVSAIASGGSAAACSARLLDLIFLPFELLFRGFEAIGRAIRQRATGCADEPMFKPKRQRGQMAVTGACSCCCRSWSSCCSRSTG